MSARLTSQSGFLQSPELHLIEYLEAVQEARRLYEELQRQRHLDKSPITKDLKKRLAMAQQREQKIRVTLLPETVLQLARECARKDES